MRTIYLFVFCSLLSSLFMAQTAITLSNTNMPGASDTLRYTNVQPASVTNYTQTGTNFNWNFENVTSTTEGRRDFKASSATPYFIFFLSASEYGEKIADTLVGGTGTLSITKVYNFYKKQTTPVNAFIADGMGMTISSIPVPSYYSDKDELYNFPMTYPKYDSTTFKFSTTTAGALPIKYSKQGYRVTTVDGWGTIKTPFGTENCLRLITTQYSKDTTTITIPAIPPLPAFPPIKIGIQNNMRSYQWMTVNSKIPYFEVSGNVVNGNFTVTQIRYRGYKISSPPPPPPPVDTGIETTADISAMEMYPNPVRDRLWFNGSSENALKVEIYNSEGKLCKTSAFENLQMVSYIDVSGLESGLYYIKFKQGDATHNCKFIKE